MQLPSQTSAWLHYVRFGIYVMASLRAAKLTALMEPVKSSTLELQSLGRAWEDADISVQEAMADRDGTDLVLDGLAREARRILVSRSANAEKTAPYTLIVPDGMAWYTAAPVDEELSRYKQLRDRLNANLPADDILRTDLVPRLEAALSVYADAEAALEDARNAEARARDQLESAQTSWRDLMDRTYGSLTAQLGSEAAERFFPKAKRRSSSDG